jgi:hypothetical protein
MFWLLLKNGVVVVLFFAVDIEVGWRISSKKFAKKDIIQLKWLLFFHR